MATGKTRHSFKAKTWKYDGPNGWVFVTLPKALAKKIRASHGHSEEGWGRLKARASIGRSAWETAIWFATKEKSYLLPIKGNIRKKEGLEIGDPVRVTLVLAPVRTPAKSAIAAGAAAPRKSGEWHVTSKNVTEEELVGVLNEDLRDAWDKLRAFAAELGEQRIYASHRSIMFSKKVCYFFVRPKKTSVEMTIFLPRKVEGLKTTPASAKGKVGNLFKLTHADQVEEPLTDWLREAYDYAPAAGEPKDR